MEFRGGLAGGGGLGRSWRDRRAERRDRRAGLRLVMERLEERVVLSTWNWTGIDSTTTTPGNWSDQNNWSPTGVPAAGDSVVFPTGLTGSQLTSNDDLTSSSFGSLGSVTIQGSGYSIASTEGYGLTLTGTISDSQATGSSTLDLPVDFGSTAGNVTVTNAGATLVMGGAISGSAGLITQGSGTVDLTGTSTITGGTTVNAGTLLVDGSIGDIVVNPGGTVGGKGAVSSISTTSGGVSPGDTSTATGILTDSGDLSMDSGSSFNVTLDGATAGTNYDQLDVGGAVNLNGPALNVSLGSFAPTPGETFTILHNTGTQAINGTFAGLPEGGMLTVSGYDFKISYVGGTDDQDVVLTAQPAPVITWNGDDVGTSDNWSDANNWSPRAPQAGDSLVFPSGVTGAALTANNDLASGTIFNSLSIGGDGYSLTGNGIGLVGSIDASGSSTSTASLPITFNQGSGSITVDNTGAELFLTGTVAATSGISKLGSGTLALSGADGTMPATVTDGTLLVDGTAGAIAVGSGATVGGMGSVSSITTTSGIVSPGDTPTSTGILTDTGNLALDSGSAFDVTLGGATVGTNYDQLAVGGTVDLADATLNVSLGSFVPTVGESFTILHNTGSQAITGTFAGLANGSTLTVGASDFVINYQGGSDGQDVVLTAVNPPTVTWSGADTTAPTPNDNWSDPNNWVGGAAPVAGDTIIFPSGLTGSALTNNDDISGGSYASILIQGGGYSIASTQGYGISLSGTVDASYASGNTVFSLPVDFTGGGASVTVDNAAAGLTMGGAIAGSGGLTKLGAGVLDVSATNTFTGATTVSAGNLLVDGTATDVAVGSGATVGGVGTVASITTTSGTVSPGNSASVTGVLTDSGDLTLDSGSTFSVNLNGPSAGTNYDQLAAGGVIDLNDAKLQISTNSFNPTPGAPFTIIHNTGTQAIEGTFDGLAEGATVTASGHQFTISYAGGTDGRDVVLTAVTPPTVVWSGTDATASPANDNWSDPNNWVGDAAPVAGDIVEFPAGPTGSALTSNNDIANTTFYSLNILASGYVIEGDAIGLAGSMDASYSSSNSTVSLPITFNPGAGTITVDDSGSTLLLSGAVSAPSGITKQGSGTLSLEANNGSTNAIVDAGTLLVDGSVGGVSANTGSTLGGTGTVAGITTVGATISPADSPTATGILTDNGNLDLNSASTFDVTLNGNTAGTGYDQLAVGGASHTIDLNNATLDVTLGSSFSFAGGQQYTILHNTTGQAITGTFNGLAQGGIITVSSDQFSISYDGGTDGQDVVLTSLEPTTTTVTPSPTTGVSGQSITLTATVKPTSGSGVPTGTVAFLASINGTSVSLGTATLNSSDVATLTTTKLTAGTDTITATYSGDATYGTSTSTSQAVTISQATSTTTLVVSPTTAAVGLPVTLTATIVAVAPGSGTPTGTVTFYDGTTAIGSAVNISDGVALLTTTSLPVGTDLITAQYSGDTNFTASTSSATSVVITSGTVTVTLSTSNPNPFALQSDTFTAIVSTATGSGTPSGTITFETAGGTILGTGTLTNGSASVTTNSLPIGQQSIIAVYSGDTNFAGTQSAPLSIVVGHSNDLYVNQIYLDIFGIPGGNVSTYWVALLNVGYPRKLVTREILKSRAAKVAAIDHVYESLLKRPATSAESRSAARKGGTSTNPLAIRIFGSREYYQTQGHGTTDGFLSALAQDWFGAPFPAIVQNRLERQLAHGTSRTQVAREVITSPNGVHAQVNTIVEEVLGQPATTRQIRQLSPLVREGNMVAVYTTLFTSSTFITKYVALT